MIAYTQENCRISSVSLGFIGFFFGCYGANSPLGLSAEVLGNIRELL